MMESNFAGSALPRMPFPYAQTSTALVQIAYPCGNHILQDGALQMQMQDIVNPLHILQFKMPMQTANALRMPVSCSANVRRLQPLPKQGWQAPAMSKH